MSSPELNNTSEPMSSNADTAENAVSQTAGKMITSARESAGLTIRELAGRMCMTPAKLELLEQDDFERLAGATYVRGYLRNTCKELDIDPAPVLAAFERQLPAQAKIAIPQEPRGPVIGGSGNAGGVLFRPMLFVAIVAAAGGYWWFNQDSMSYLKPQAVAVSSQAEVTVPQTDVVAGTSPATLEDAESALAEPEVGSEEIAVVEVEPTAVSDESPQVKVQLETAAATAPPQSSGVSEQEIVEVESEPVTQDDAAETVAEETEAVEAPVAEAIAAEEPVAPSVAAAPVPAGNTDTGASIAIAFSEESWVEVTDASGRKLLAKLQPAGSSVQLQGEAPFSLMLGNAAATTVSYQGEVVDSAPLGNRRTRKLTVGG